MIRTISTATNDDGDTEEIEYHEYAAFWGCDPCYDRPPRRRGDGYKFYNFASGEYDGKPARLIAFQAAIRRTMQSASEEGKRELQELYDHVQADIMALRGRPA